MRDGGAEGPAEGRECPDCNEEMAVEDTGYVLLWSCENDDCGNFETYWRVYDWEIFAEVKHVQSAVGQAAAERLAGEYKDGALA